MTLESRQQTEEQIKAMKELSAKFQTVFNNPTGQEILEHLATTAYFDRTHNGDVLHEGKRALFLHIKNMIDYEKTEQKINMLRQHEEENDDII